MAEIIMKPFQAELGGIITRDIIWREVEAVSEEQARQMLAETYPGYRIRAIFQAPKDGPTEFEQS